MAVATICETMLALVNQQRSEAGLDPLTLNPQLEASAQRHSQDMAANDFMEHRGSDGSSPSDRIQQAGYAFSYDGENIAAGQTTPEEAMADWMNETPPNDGHRRNILSPNFSEIGFGYAFSATTAYKHYWTQDFGSPQ